MYICIYVYIYIYMCIGITKGETNGSSKTHAPDKGETQALKSSKEEDQA